MQWFTSRVVKALNKKLFRSQDWIFNQPAEEEVMIMNPDFKLPPWYTRVNVKVEMFTFRALGGPNSLAQNLNEAVKARDILLAKALADLTLEYYQEVLSGSTQSIQKLARFILDNWELEINDEELNILIAQTRLE